MRGDSASGLLVMFGVLVWFVFVWLLGLLVFFSPSSCCVSFPFNDDLGTPPTWRPHSWKKWQTGELLPLKKV